MSLTRRQLLASLGASLLPLPRAHATEGPVQRVLFLMNSLGVPKDFRDDQWFDGWETASTSPLGALKPILAPLSPFAQHMLVLGGVDGAGGAHPEASFSTLTGATFTEVQAGGFPSLDTYLSHRLVSDAPYPSVKLNYKDHPSGGYTYTEDGRELTALSASLAHARLFGSLGVDARQTTRNRQVLTNFMSSRLARLVTEASPADAARLAGDFESVQDFATRLTQTGACTSPPPLLPADSNSQEEQIRRLYQVAHDAFVCDSTRILTVDYGGARSGLVHDWIPGHPPLIGTAQHTLSHQSDDPSRLAMCAIRTWQAERLAEVLSSWAVTPDPAGSGSILDNTIVLWTTEVSDGINHSSTDFPLVLLGGANTAIRQGGWFVRDGDAHIADVLTSIAAAVGFDAPFGSSVFVGRTPRVMSELLV